MVLFPVRVVVILRTSHCCVAINILEIDPALYCARSFGAKCRIGRGGEDAMGAVRLCDCSLLSLPCTKSAFRPWETYILWCHVHTAVFGLHACIHHCLLTWCMCASLGGALYCGFHLCGKLFLSRWTHYRCVCPEYCNSAWSKPVPANLFWRVVSSKYSTRSLELIAMLDGQISHLTPFLVCNRSVHIFALHVNLRRESRYACIKNITLPTKLRCPNISR